MMGTYEVAVVNRPIDIILESLNGFNSRKNAGVLKGTELSSLIVQIGDLFANKVKQGKVTKDEIESFESHITQFQGENKDKYFAYPHEELDRGTKIALESIDFAREEVKKRNVSAQPVMDADSYERTFRRLG